VKVTVYGSRGSVPISNPESIRYGGNTTCIRVISDCIPKGMAVILDAGSGIVPCSFDLLKEGGIHEVIILFTHWHHDHTLGLFLSPLLYRKDMEFRLYGPIQYGIGPKEMLDALMVPPFFPVHHKKVASRIVTRNIEFPETTVGLFHPQGGFGSLPLDQYERFLKKDEFIPIGKGKYPVKECLVVTMHVTNHPEETISYRFEERPTGSNFVFLTDHENLDGMPTDLNTHIADADLLIMDGQYSEDVYRTWAAGFGHGTPGYCVRVAKKSGARKLGITHHAPSAKDADIEAIQKEAEAGLEGAQIQVFTCADYQTIEV